MIPIPGICLLYNPHVSLGIPLPRHSCSKVACLDGCGELQPLFWIRYAISFPGGSTEHGVLVLVVQLSDKGDLTFSHISIE